MAAAVDYCQPVATPHTPIAGATPASAFTCTACSESFGGAPEQRAHCKSERHVYNTKRRLAGLKPISQEAWERKLKETRGAAGEEKNKGKAHLKAGKEPKAKGGGYNAGDNPPVAPGAQDEAAAAVAEETAPEPFVPERCLFDKRKFDTVDACLEYMWKTYSFSVPDREYCTDLTGLLTMLHKKFTEEPHACLYCHRRFPDTAAVKRHMLDMRHTRIGTEARTRRGHHQKAGTHEMQAETEKFFDFHSSTKEITEKMQNPVQKAASLLRFFDEDRDGFLKFKELAALWSAANDGAVLGEAEYVGACGMTGAEPAEGLDAKALHGLYSGGLADLDSHFAMLQEALQSRLTARSKARREAAEAAETIEEGDEDAEDDEDEEDGDEDDEDGDSDGTEVLECDDEEEFEEVMRVLGLQPATILDSGDLQLPNGRTVCNRDVAYIWKQRGTRHSNMDIVLSKPKTGPKVRTPLMLTSRGDGCTKIAMSHRAQAKEGKKMVAVLRRAQHEAQKLALQENICMKSRGLSKIRTQFGDASGGR